VPFDRAEYYPMTECIRERVISHQFGANPTGGPVGKWGVKPPNSHGLAGLGELCLRY